jgi:hypothetical protein
MKKLSLSLLLLLSFVTVFAQQANDVEMADAMRSSGKIYVFNRPTFEKARKVEIYCK